VTSIAWFRENSHGKMSKVVDFPTEQAKDHPFGLLHMHGLVNEWCQNEYDEHAYIHAVNGYRIGRKPKTPLRVYRGGSWKMSSNHCRSSSRFGRLPGSFNDNKGIRLCLAPKF
jgi:formylglycine-generating enzyme required for sulfatase activity